MQFNKNFIGNPWPNKIMNFLWGTDSQELYLKNAETQPTDWYYRDRELIYSYNEYGHRSKNISDIDLDNYILFTGCSHTEGVGLELEKTYPYQVAQKLGCDYYNLGLGGTGIDVVEHNLIQWFLTVQKKPKHLFIQWPDHSRFISQNNNPRYTNLVEEGTWAKPNSETFRFIVGAEESGFNFARKELYKRLILEIANCPVTTVGASSNMPYDSSSIYLFQKDLARDLSHFGNISHRALADDILSSIIV